MKRTVTAIGMMLSLMLALVLAPMFTPTMVPPVQAQSAANITSLNPVFKPPSFNFTATATKNTTVAGMSTIVILTKGTFTGMTFNVLGSSDGVNFVALPIVAGLVGGPPPGAAATQPVTAANPAYWTTGVKGLTQIQISNICTACTGTVTFQLTGQGN